MALFTAAPKNLCVLRLSAIGDVCHAISVVQAIQQHWPSTKITWVVGKVEAQLINDLPNINVIVFDKKQGLQGMRNVWKQLAETRFDVLLHMQAALRASMLSLGIKAHYRVGFSRNRSREGQYLFTNRHLPDTEAFHVLDNFAEFARYLGVPMGKPSWNIPLSEQDRAFASGKIRERTLVICPAASKDERNWLVERYAEVADYAASLGMDVVLCGSPSQRERTLGETIQHHSKTKITNLIGQTSLKQLTAVLAQAQVVIAPDSGPAHIATTQGTPVIGLYAHSNPKRTGPYNSQAYVVSCYDTCIQQQDKSGSWGARAKGDTLMENITVQSVIKSLDKVLNSNHEQPLT
ncbi:glycosyltransferase family 9 protein [Vibrio salilacus]|uniref:glycosyltransferase family 9 protein n=1 Tax=Vibrio salilacus TaxID=1323749 RepID=UPI000C2B2377|nr:glycosyltransferase family 9 protein [Vibrio salilacus]